MRKVNPFKNSNGQAIGYFFICPGCQKTHTVFVAPYKAPNGASWEFNGDLESPSFSPSLIQKVCTSKETSVCHLFVKDGKLKFLPDCTHEMANRIVEMYKIDILDATIRE